MKILILRLSSLGDIVHSLPVLTQIKQALPQASISWLVSHRFAELLDGHSLIECIIPWKGNWAELPALISDLREQKFNYTLDLQGLIKSGLIASLSGAKHIVGLSPARERLSEIFWTERVKSTSVLNQQRHVIERNLDILKALSLKVNLSSDTKENFQLAELTSLPSSLTDKKFILCAPDSRWESKNWPEEYWLSLLKRLTDRYNHKLVLLASRPHAAFSTLDNKIVDLGGQTSLKDLKSIIPQASLLIGSDSGLLHLAAAYGVPTLGIFGPTSPYRTGPWKGHYLHSQASCSPCHKRQCPLSGADELKCLKEITPEQILSSISELLA